ncbi:MAG: DUF3892 domain-containing protein [Oscillospiraceae bacterium]|nr:DUF3892 domain-containing protein [Oscillospiraceae bacterium]
MKNTSNADLAARAMKEIPQPQPNAKRIVALAKEGGKITGYQLSDGRVLSKEEGILEARNGGIMGVGVSERRGSEYLKSIPDENSTNNLSNLPTVKG